MDRKNIKTILLVDKDVSFAEAKKNELEEFGYNVLNGYSGKDAIEIANTETDIALILMDINIDGESQGIETAKNILKKLRIPIIFISSSADTDKIRKAEEINSYGFIPKTSDKFTFNTSIKIAFRLYNSEKLITAQEIALKGNEEKFQLITEQSLLCIIIIQDGFIKYINQTACDFCEYTQKEAYENGQNWFFSRIHEDDRDFAMEQLRKKQHGENGAITNYSYRIKTKSGKMKWIDQYSKTITFEGQNADMICIVDITEFMQIKEKLLESEEKYRIITESILDIPYSADAKGNLTYIGPQISVFGLHPEQMISKSPIEYILPDDVPTVMQNFQRSVETGEVLATHFRMMDPSGAIHWIEDIGKMQHDTTGNITGIMGILRDITKRKEMEEALKESNENFRGFSEQSPNMIFINQGGQIIYANSLCTEVMNYSKDEFYSPEFDFMSLIAPESKKEVETAFSKHMKGEDVEPYDYSLITKDGRQLQAMITTKLIQYENKPAILGIITDITQRKQAEKEKERLLKELQDSFEKIKKLSGLLPICASCKKIRDDNGYWNQVESYIEKHSEAYFSHSICEECAERLYSKEKWYKNCSSEKNKDK